MNTRAFLSVSAACLLALIASQAEGAIVYSNDFESNTNGFDSTSTMSWPTDGAGYGSANQSTYLGVFSGGSTSLTLTGLVSGSTYSVAFDLFLAESWDGNGSVSGPDYWKLSVDGGPTLINATFSNVLSGDDIPSLFQSYTDTNVIGPGMFPARTGADVSGLGGPGQYGYTIYYFGHGTGNPLISFTPAASTATLVFADVGLSGWPDEGWGIDNVLVTGDVAAVPEPGSLTLLGLGAIGMLGAARRRQTAA